MRRFWTYSLISKALGIILLSAGLLKLVQALSIQSGSLIAVPPAASVLEILFGGWLILGVLPRVSRWLAIGCFVGLAHVALFMAFDGRASCGCLGQVPVRPWLAATFDFLATLALIFSPPIARADFPTGRLAVRLYLVSGILSLMLLALLLAVFLTSDTANTVQPQLIKGQPDARVAAFVTAINANYERLPPISIKTKTIIENANGDDKVVETESKERTISVILFSKRVYNHQYWLNGPDVRRDAELIEAHDLKDSPVSKTAIIRHDKAMYLDKNAKTLTIRPSPLDESVPIDPRSFGILHKKINSYASLLESATPTKLSYDEKAQHVSIDFGPFDKSGCTFTLVLAAGYNHLPVSAIYRARDGSIITKTDISYEKVTEQNVWLLNKAVSYRFTEGTTFRPVKTGWHSKISLEAIASPSAYNDPNEVFDLTLPAETSVKDLITGSSAKIGEDTPISKVTFVRRAPRPVNKWWLIGTMDLFLIAAALIRRRVYRPSHNPV